MSPTPNSPDSDQARQALLAASVGYARVAAGGVLAWCNRAFEEAAAARGLSADVHAEQIAQEAAKQQAEGRTALVHSVGDQGDRLIELLPLASPTAAAEARPARDELTGVLTRQAFVERLANRLAERGGDPLALVFLDLDGFKSVNDRYGHLVGDACLRQIGQRLTATVRGADLVGRFGGDEFLLLLEGVRDGSCFEPIAQRLRESLSAELVIPDVSEPIHLGGSLGAAYPGSGSATVDDLIAAADRAMYASKREADRPPS